MSSKEDMGYTVFGDKIVLFTIEYLPQFGTYVREAFLL
jgi:hypothetical protein